MTASVDVPGLNEDQLKAVTYMGGPLRILAGAGTGKTQTLTARFVHLVEVGGVPANRILALTFSRKAAEEMRHRVLAQLEGGYPDLWIQTFHSFCLRLVSEWRREEGKRPPTIIDVDVRRWNASKVVAAIPDDRLRYYRSLPARRKLTADLLTLADRAKEHLLDVPEIDRYAAAKESVPGRLHDLAVAFRAYQDDLQQGDASDFGDLAMTVVRRLNADAGLLARTRSRFAHVLVDEFQDTNEAQFALLQLLVPQGGQLCVVGDPNQAIYAFRGGRPEYMERFDSHYPGAATFELTTNYRSGPEILNAANRLIAHNAGGARFTLKPSAHNAAAEVTVTELATVDHEAEFIARRILALLRDERTRYRYGDIAILFRSLKSSQEPVIRALTANGIPYRLGGGKATAQYDVVRDLIAAFRLVIGPARWADAVTLAVVQGELATEFRALEARFGPRDLDDALRPDAARLPELTAAEAVAIDRVRDVAQRAAAERDQPLPALVYHAMRLSGHLRDAHAAETGRFLSAVLEQAVALSEKGAAAEFLEQFVAGYEQDDDEAPSDAHGVQLLTVHAAKGLEWPVVFIAGFADGLFPLPMRLDRDFDLDELAGVSRDGERFVGQSEGDRAKQYLQEERRLAYVALTRGKQAVHLTVPRAHGKGALAASPFVAEIALADAVTQPEADGPPATMRDLARRLRTRRQRALAALIDDGTAAEELAALLLSQWAATGLVDGAIPVRDRLIPAPNEDGKPLTFSYSQLGTYEACPRRYLYESVLRLETDEEASTLVFGSAVHSALSRLNECWREQGAPPSDDEIDEVVERTWPEAGFDCAAQRKQLRLRAGAMLRRFYARERSRLPQRVPIAIEASFNELYGPHQIKGRIDLVLQSEAGGVEIVDFKTSKPNSPSINKPAESMQLFLYDRVWRERDPNASPRVAFYALRHLDDKGFATASDWSDGQELGLTHDEASSEPLRLRIDGLLAGMLANQFQPLPNDDACGFCRCRWLCPEG